MAGTRILFKMASGFDHTAGVQGFGGWSMRLEPLFSPPAQQPGMAAAEGAAAGWFITDAGEMQGFGPASAHPWDIAHAALEKAIGLHGTDLLAVEPDLEQSWLREEPSRRGLAAIAPGTTCEPAAQRGPPYDPGKSFGWHLGADFTDLAGARSEVGGSASDILIAHLDTGYDKTHKALPPNLAPADMHRNFVETDRPNDASDYTPEGGLLRALGHGTGTLGILAGGDAQGLNPRANLGDIAHVPDGFGPIGGAPLAKIVPVRIANSVVHFWSSTVAQGIDYARRIGADVLSMSMGGLPSAAWADAVNAAYEAGVVLVCAAGNSYGGLPTSLIVYPARFNRVIAACGVMAERHPYYGLGGPMEGNVGPAVKMRTAMAAYTPNIPWLRLGCPDVIDMNGQGTSAATPQIAAAAALWLAKHGHGYPRGWQRVEAVRAALFEPLTDAGPDRYFGRGTLRARASLAVQPEIGGLQETPRDSASFGFLKLLTGAFGAAGHDPRQREMFRLELTQLALNSRGAREAVPEPSLPFEVVVNGDDPAEVAEAKVSERARRRFLEAILDDAKCSLKLRGYLESSLGRSITQRGADLRETANVSVGRAIDGRGLQRQLKLPAPTRRRLRVFATDPSDGACLETAFINTATVEVPWERLDPGPVGEYVEVVDVDPASELAYTPVDLDDGAILAQDGFAPSEGNPQFHQQMVYAVAMRTIRNFEIALGRRALWSERFVPREGGVFVPAPDCGYVQRLRIYPHALREKNAYYSPERKALLFGYFDAPGDTPRVGRRTIFTCLSHDVVAHETTHALLDGLHRRFQEPTNPDVLAFHEAFADIVAIFQHFTFPELLRFEISRMRGNMSLPSILSDLARQFGRALHNKRALRSALVSVHDDGRDGDSPALMSYDTVREAHDRGAILVAAVFEAFSAIYKRRTADLFRLATGGTGVLVPGAIHPDLVQRLTDEAVRTAQYVLTTAIRALDYMPPVDPTFGDYLRAIVTADANTTADRSAGLRVALVEAFLRRGIYPDDISSVAPDTLLWQPPFGLVQSSRLKNFIQGLDLGTYIQKDRRTSFDMSKRNAAALHEWMADNLDTNTAGSIGLDFPETGRARFEVHSVRPALRVTDDGENRIDVVAVITQWRNAPIHKDQPEAGSFKFRGGCTLLLDRDAGTDPIRYAISRPLWSEEREERIRHYTYPGEVPTDVYGAPSDDPLVERFAALHSALN